MEHPIVIDSNRNIGEAQPAIVWPTVRRVKFPTYNIVDNPTIQTIKIDFKKLMSR